MSDGNLTPKSALRLEFFIIGLGILALIMIFQPFSIWLVRRSPRGYRITVLSTAWLS